jgi:hypothetical protein
MNIRLTLPPEPPTWLGVLISIALGFAFILAVVLLHSLTR